MIRIMLSIGIALTLSSVLGCVSQIHYTLEPADATTEAACVNSADADPPEQIVGIALSGGGSRAAVFGAASLEALWEHGLTDLVTHVSSVSGGSLASSYFIANQPACDALDSDPEREACWRDFFGEFKQIMRSNYLYAMEGRQFTKFRWFSNTRRATSLAEVFDDRFLHGATFGDLADQSAGAKSAGREPPVLLINGASYDSGRRFVFSNLCFSETPAPAVNEITTDPINNESLRALTFSRADCARPTPGDLPVSLAVATSAAFPGIGPVSVKVPSTCEGGSPEYWHFGDGGLFENSGVDTLEEIVLRAHRAKPRSLNRALIISLNSGKAADEDALKNIENFWLYRYHAELLVESYSRRANGYHDVLWEQLHTELADQGLRIENMEFQYTSAKLDRWPDSCKQAADSRQQSTEQIRAAISAELTKIKTSFKIKECHADLLELAAHEIIHSRLDSETMERLKDMGFPVRETQIEH